MIYMISDLDGFSDMKMEGDLKNFLHAFEKDDVFSKDRLPRSMEELGMDWNDEAISEILK